MAQFDVYINPSSKTRDSFPYLVDIQQPLLGGIATRIVIPLGKAEKFNNEAMKNLTPLIKFESEQLLLLVPQIAAIPKKILKNPVGTLAHFRAEIIAAVDFAITGI
jgi:toxin CcdB